MKLKLFRQFCLATSLAICSATPFGLTLNATHIDVVGPPPETILRRIIKFDHKDDEFPGAVALGLSRDLYVGFPGLNQIRHYNQAGDFLAKVDLPVGFGNTTEGIAVRWNGDLYCVVNSYNVGDSSAHGIWKITPKKHIHKFADIDVGSSLGYLVFDKSDHLYLSDKLNGKILKIDHNGKVHHWLSHSLLRGNPDGNFILGVPQGANGIAMGKKRKNLFVANTDYGRILRIKINQDGSAGKVKVFAEDSSLEGVVGLSFNRRGILYATVPYQNTIIGIHSKGDLETIVTGSPLEFPTGIVMKKKKGINLGFFSNGAYSDKHHPGIYRIKVACDPMHAD